MKINVVVTTKELNEMVLEKFFKGMDLVVDKSHNHYITSMDFHFVDKKEAAADLIKKKEK